MLFGNTVLNHSLKFGVGFGCLFRRTVTVTVPPRTVAMSIANLDHIEYTRIEVVVLVRNLQRVEEGFADPHDHWNSWQEVVKPFPNIRTNIEV